MAEAGEGPGLRHEFKLKLAVGHAFAVQSTLSSLPGRIRVSFPARTVNTAYFDTPQLDCFTASIEGLFERYKLRLRWYGREEPHEVFLEWKSRRGVLGLKRRFPIPWTGPLSGRDWSEVRGLLRAGVPPELLPCFVATCVPTLFSRYDRTYLESEDRRCRVTIDERLGYLAPPGMRTVRLSSLIRRPGVIVEVKVQPSDRGAAEPVLRALRSRPQRCSKYAESLRGTQW